MFFNENQINNLQITFTDENNNVLNYLNNFTVSLRINTSNNIKCTTSFARRQLSAYYYYYFWENIYINFEDFGISKNDVYDVCTLNNY